MSIPSPSVVPNIPNPPPGEREPLLEVIGHLGAALIQTVPSDDPIIIEHIRTAHRIALELYRDSSATISHERIDHGTAC